MNATKKTLTTLSAAAALALGGIAIAQTDANSSSPAADASLGSSSTMQSTDTPASDTSTLNNDTSTLGAGSSTLSDQSSSDLSNEPVAQMDRG